MIVPSIDLQGGHAVQLIGGRERALDAGDPAPILARFQRAGEVAVIDLDAALGQGDNTATIRALCRQAPCRVGGGIRSAEAALAWLDAGAEKVILGTAATPEVLRQLPRERVIAALDAVHGEVVVEGWRTRTGATIAAQMRLLRPHVSGFLVTFVEREGRMGGTHLDQVPALVEAAGEARLTIAGGVTTPEDIAALDRMGADAQVGMALYTGRMHLADALAAPLRSDRPDGLWPTIVCEEGSGSVLGLVYSSAESLRVALDEGRGIYASRRRGLWRKGESSGDIQELVRVQVDCDRDALCFVVRQKGRGFCHTGVATCFGPLRGLSALDAQIRARRIAAPPGSYTARLFAEPGLLAAKIREEGNELADALSDPADPDAVIHEAADVLYFTLAALAQAGTSLAAVEAELDRRARRVSRRPGDAKIPSPSPSSSSETDR